MFRKAFEGKGLYDARVGYIGGDIKSPSYRSVCSGNTGRKCARPYPIRFRFRFSSLSKRRRKRKC
jgi:hypothetical protein